MHVDTFTSHPRFTASPLTGAESVRLARLVNPAESDASPVRRLLSRLGRRFKRPATVNIPAGAPLTIADWRALAESDGIPHQMDPADIW